MAHRHRLHRVLPAALALGLSATAATTATAMEATAAGGAAPTLAASAAPAADPIQLPVRRFTLPNGLVLLVYTDHAAPSVYVGLRYRIGSRDEGPHRTGFAHLFEHLMFQSTRYRKEDFLPTLSAVGASDINGMTTSDWTEFHETVPTGALDLALWLEADRMANLMGGITQQELDEQRGVVQNEKRQGEIGPGAHASERFLAGFYPPDHPYAHPVIGAMADLDAASLGDVAAWYQDYYGAGNAVLVLAGDIDAERAQALVTRAFGAVRRGTAFDRMQQWVPQFGAIKRDRIFDDVATATLARSWPVANDDPRALTLLLLAARTMSGSRSSPLYQKLVEQQHVASAVTATLNESALGSTFSIELTLQPGVALGTASAALDAALDSFLADGPPRARLDAVITAADTTLLNLIESAPEVGGWLLAGETEHGDPLHFLKQRHWIATATPAETRDIARIWLQRPYFELQTLPRPHGGDAAASAASPAASSATGPAAVASDRTTPPGVTSSDGSFVFPPVRTADLPNGLHLVVAERHGHPLVQAMLQFPTGTLADPQPGSGTAAQAFTMLSGGTARLDASALAARMAQLGMAVSVAPGAQRSSISWGTTRARLDPTLALVAQMVRAPAYPQDPIDRAIAAVDPAFAARAGNPAEAADALLARALWGETHPLGRIATPAAAKQLSRAALRAFHDRMIVPAGATLFLVGDITLAQARVLVERAFGDWHGNAPALAPVPPPPAASGARVILVDAPGAEQATISAGALVAPFDAAQAATEAMANAALGGSFESRLNTELREKRGWAYGVSSAITGPTGAARLFSLTGGVQTDKAAASLAVIRDQISAYTGPAAMTAAELERERMAVIRTLPASYATNAAFMGALGTAAAAGLPWDRAASTAARLRAVTLADARSYAARTFHADRLTWVVVGDLRKIEPGIRALALGPVEVWDVAGTRLR